MQGELLNKFEQLWESADDPPDVFTFLRNHDNPEAAHILKVLLADQKYRWQSDAPLKVEDYLAEVPEMNSDEDLRLQLLFGEFDTRSKLGQNPDLDEYRSRFGDIARQLEQYVSGIADTVNSDNGQPNELPASMTATAQMLTGLNGENQQLGRYQIVRQLGAGAFGQVWLARDGELQRFVAIKVPNPERFTKPEDAESYLAEARTVATLDHPNIVPVFDVGRDHNGLIYVVSKYIEGTDLSKKFADKPMSFQESVSILIPVAHALHHAHQKRIIHRDIKGANILIEESSNIPYVADFGLARREEDFVKSKDISGTPGYMSPEQARGEGHRLDARSDVFSLAVVFYRLLTGRRAFRGATMNETLHRVINVDPVPPRQIDSNIPAELERICLKSLSKLASSRHESAAAFAEDLEQWLQPASGNTEQKMDLQIVPKGLRSFDASDADFFLELLPGPRNRDGLPESIEFWKRQIEESDPERTFSVGLIYGPSGCGKSSLMKAALLPRLADDVTAIYLEATPEETELRILRGLRKRFSSLPQNANIVETFAALRRDGLGKVVIVLDQFEQWLHGHRTEADSELVNALRQCDGGSLHAIVMVRDDFAMAAARLMNMLDIPIVQGHNFTTVDLFDSAHAAKVLTRFGQAFGKLPSHAGDLSADEDQFINDVVDGLAEDGKVVSVRISLFAEMVKSKPWIPATLQQVGGARGIGLNFLEETFCSPQSNPRHRLLAGPARAVLQALLPEFGTDIKGHMKSQDELVAVSRIQDPNTDTASLLRVLDGELRLITPTDPAGKESQSRSGSESMFYQLTHDYLVPSLREWLTRQQRESREGRAELLLSERADLWTSKRETRHLPSLLEWLNIRSATKARRWTDDQRLVMKQAARYHGVRIGMVAAMLVAVIATGVLIANRNRDDQRQLKSRGLVDALRSAETNLIASKIDRLAEFRDLANPMLRSEFEQALDDSNAKLNVALALVGRGEPADPETLGYLSQRLIEAQPRQMEVVIDLLRHQQAKLTPDYWKTAFELDEDPHKRFHAACVLAQLDPENSKWEDVEFTNLVAAQLVDAPGVFLEYYQDLVQPVSEKLVPPLSRVFLAGNQDRFALKATTNLLTDFAANDVDTLVELQLGAEPAAEEAIFAVLEKHRDEAIAALEPILQKTISPVWPESGLDSNWSKPTPATQLAIETAHGLISDDFAYCVDMPWSKFLEVAESLRASGYRPTKVRPFLAKKSFSTASSPSISVACVWTRDELNWKLSPEVQVADLEATVATASSEQLMVADLAAVPSASGAMIVLFCEQINGDEERGLVVNQTADEFSAAAAQMVEDGFVSQCTISVSNGSDGQRLYCGVWSKWGESANFNLAYPGFELVDRPQWDIAVAGVEQEPTEPRQDRFAAIWRPNVEFESQLVDQVSAEKSRNDIKQLLQHGFRPVAIAAQQSQAEEASAFTTVSMVLHRPLVADAEKESLAIRQAAASTTLLKLDASANVWPLLKHSSDPRVVSQILDRLKKFRVPSGPVVGAMQQASDASQRSSLVLAIGQLAESGKLTSAEFATVTSSLLQWYADDPDSGVHSAIEWTLQQMKQSSGLKKIREAYSLGAVVGDRNWYVSKHGEHTLAVVKADEFLMGSPVSESERRDGPRAEKEYCHRCRIGRDFAIGTKEVTVAQVKAFLPEYQCHPTASPDAGSPATLISWFDAIAYCNWLSEEEGVPQDQWCYVADSMNRERLILADDCYERTGYRLPNESEWEYAARSGTSTSRYYGETPTLLSNYAWYTDVSKDRYMLPTGTLLPNRFGLFDVLGNAMEWCQEPLRTFDRSNPVISDIYPNKILEADSRIIRGGCFGYSAADARSAFREVYPPAAHWLIGFRIARTLKSKEE